MNKRNALGISLILMPRFEFTLMDLFLSITQLSYKGDIRMKFKAENPNKVRNIVEPNFDHFLDYYENWINQFEEDKVIVYKGNSIFEINPTVQTQQYLVDCIPKSSYLRLWIKEKALSLSWDDLKYQLALNLEIQNYKTSKKAISKAIYSTNPIKNMLYALDKKRKSKIK